MSHYAVAIFTKEEPYGTLIENILAPYDENLSVEFCENESTFVDKSTGENVFEYDYDEERGVHGYWHNPNAKWDWYSIGGRWSDFIDCNPTLLTEESTEFGYDKEEYDAAIERYNSDDDMFNMLTKPHYRDAKQYAECCAINTTFAFVDVDGEWHERGEMGWFGYSYDTPESIDKYAEEFKNYIDEAKKNEYWVTIVDCHI